MAFVLEDEPQQQRFVLEDTEGGDSMEWKDVLVSSVKNLPKSTLEYFKDVGKAVIHPIDTAKGVGHLLLGAVQKVAPGEQQDEKYVDALVDHYKGMYGSVDSFKKTLAEDPAQIWGDAVMVLTGGGGALKVAGMGSKVSKVGAAVSKAAANLEPVSIATRAASAPARMIPDKWSEALYERAAKFPTVMPKGPKQREKIVKTALREQIMPTKKGYSKLNSKIEAVSSKIDEIIGSKQDDAMMPINNLVDEFPGLEQKALRSGVDPIQSAKAIGRVKRELLDANKMIGRRGLTPTEAQTFKKDIYKQLDTLYAKEKTRPAKRAAQMQEAKNTKEFLEQVAPEIKGLNLLDGELLELRGFLEAPVERISHLNMLGMDQAVKIGAGGAIAGVPGMVAAGIVSLADRPKIASWLALKTYKWKKEGYKANAKLAAAKAAMSSLQQTEGN